ncbi:polyisoprenyl-teichoic acid--peptidoglycan teichoic acid transferase TagU [Bacillus sp. FJAT-45066]|uniref:polyisoprenyl-teichoic acid--peptidoglycan teichoic acid transferase TagU n=1 Tax=Bacillus sp. FJAT-45066 TaxID=2011010 RepID=UPI000BB97321|nr:LytR family transcriptional regulator [Bacillus sp. FJAT-45066]
MLEAFKKRKVLWTIVGIFSVATIAVGIYAFTIYKSLEQTVASMHEPLNRDVPQRVDFKKKEPLSFLVLGVDERPGDRGRSDTMIVLTVNPNKQSVQMLSIPRDTRTEIIGRGYLDKINHAYAFGGVEMSVDTVENFLNIPIDYYFKVNMDSFKDIVDAVGGITVNNPLEFTQGGQRYNKGPIELDGKGALNFVQMRKQDPRGDFGRQERQRLVLKGVIDKGASFSSITRFGDILDALGNNIKTNLTFDEMVEVQANYKESRHDLVQHEIKGTGQTIDKIWYLVVPEENRLEISNTLREHLELD